MHITQVLLNWNWPSKVPSRIKFNSKLGNLMELYVFRSIVNEQRNYTIKDLNSKQNSQKSLALMSINNIGLEFIFEFVVHVYGLALVLSNISHLKSIASLTLERFCESYYLLLYFNKPFQSMVSVLAKFQVIWAMIVRINSYVCAGKWLTLLSSETTSFAFIVAHKIGNVFWCWKEIQKMRETGSNRWDDITSVRWNDKKALLVLDSNHCNRSTFYLEDR